MRRTARPAVPPPVAEWLTPKQAADHIQRSPCTLKRWRSKGGGPPFVRFDDKEVRYSKAKLNAWMDAREGSEPEDFKPYRPTIVRAAPRAR